MKRKDRSSTSAKEERKSKKTKKVTEVEEIQQASKLDFSSPDKLFSSLVAPTTSESFFSDYWEKKPLLIQRNDTSFYGPLFTKEDLEDILKREELSFAEDVNVVRYEDGDKLYMNGDPEERATWSQVNKDIKERHATVQFHQPQRFKVCHLKTFVLFCEVAFSLYKSLWTTVSQCGELRNGLGGEGKDSISQEGGVIILTFFVDCGPFLFMFASCIKIIHTYA